VRSLQAFSLQGFSSQGFSSQGLERDRGTDGNVRPAKPEPPRIKSEGMLFLIAVFGPVRLPARAAATKPISGRRACERRSSYRETVDNARSDRTRWWRDRAPAATAVHRIQDAI